MGIRRGTTPLLTIDADGIALQDHTVYITFEQGHRQLTKIYPIDESVDIVPVYDQTEEEQTGSEITVILSQSDTLYFHVGMARVQIRWIEEDGTAHETDIKPIELTKSLLEGVIEYYAR